MSSLPEPLSESDTREQPYQRHAASLAGYLRGISAGDFPEAISALLGKDAPKLSPVVVTRLTATGADEYAGWQRRDPSARCDVYV